MSETSTEKGTVAAEPTAKKRRAAQEEFDVDLRVPWLAGVLAWLVPGLGHWYQGRRAKAIIYAAAIWPILLAGLWMGSYWEATPNGDSARRLLVARNVYWSWRSGDKRLYFVPQAAVGAVAIPAYLQARNLSDGDGGVLSTAFAPPRLPSESSTRPNQPSAAEIAANLHSWLDAGTIFTVVAGLLNLLAIFDAAGGPIKPVEEEEDDEKKDDDAQEGDDAK
ncbi:MAG: hypothetical protein IJ387_10150 [Thermoguttaceae bacterium]|nr:hypothetical protein [Thermoguttaceae bacterium]